MNNLFSRRRLLDRCGRAGIVGALAALVAPATRASGVSALDDTLALPPFVHARAEWGATPPTRPMRLHDIDRVTVHHTGPPRWDGQPATDAYLRAIQAFHTGPERGWPDIAYHLLIDLDGGVWAGRPPRFAGDTATAYDPAGHALVAVLGDYEAQTPTAAQARALSDTVRWLLEAHALNPAALGGHRDYAATLCPGRTLYPLVISARQLDER